MADEERTISESDEREVPRPSSTALKNYPPLVAMVVALLIVVLVLPSALNLPQANPSQVLEYAPIPPEDDSPPPTSEGSISALGLGSSGTLRQGLGGEVGGTSAGPSKGEKPVAKRCVGNPPRQTEDPNAPPCVPFFEGDNGGETWQGVTGQEIMVLIYADTYCTTGGRSNNVECTPDRNTYCDVETPQDDPNNRTCHARDYGSGESLRYDWQDVMVYRAYSKYFNQRFQTYDRHVHFIIYWSPARSAASRRAEAADNWDRLKPFAVLQRPQFGGFDDVYTDAMVKRRTMSFGALPPRPNVYYRTYAPPKFPGGMIWNFWPDVEHWADQYVGYICSRVKAASGTVQGSRSNPPSIDGRSLVGQPRKYAFMRTTDDRFPQFKYFADLVKTGTQQCGITYADEIKFSRHQYSVDTHPDAFTESEENVARIKGKGITTIIWAAGYEVEHGKAMERKNYFPEIFVVHDQWHGEISKARFQNQRVWSNAVLMSNDLLEDKEETAPCRQAYREADPNGTFYGRACEVYHDFFMLFKAIQVAGPILGPDTVDQGQHAIPVQESTSPYVAACFFDPNDYTCVKDAREAWWDPNAPDPDGDPDELGCWRLTNGGKRYLANRWDSKSYAFQNPNDPCDNQGNSVDINPYGPEG
ncbi:MAG: hypothetical protein KY429_01940 [Actinobacteria bacterium]|nr:hypothetical protein [Actinomycetota bacterium]